MSQKKKPSAEPEVMEKIVSLCKRRGFVFQSSEIYGGLKSCYDYGPLGAELKRNVKAEWWRTMVHEREDVVGLDASIIMHPKVWQASGHLSGFTDPMSSCRFCHKSFRADHVWELVAETDWYRSLAGLYDDRTVTGLGLKKWATKKGKKLAPNLAVCRDPDVTLSWLQEKATSAEQAFEISMKDLVQHLATMQLPRSGLQVPCPDCGGELMEPRPFNLMFRSSLGPVDPIEAVAKRLEGKGLAGEELRKAITEAVTETAIYLRPETAQAMFVNFLNVQQAARIRPPFGIAQQGKSFRNEITVKHFTFRSCEFEQMEMEFFVPPPEYCDEGKRGDMAWYEYWCNERLEWYAKLGIKREKLRLRPHEKEELAHYAKACSDVEYDYPWGWGELEGIAHRTDFDLKAHEKASGKKLTYFDPDKKAHYHPFVIEPAAGADRAALAFLLDAYTEEPPTEMRKSGRTLLKLHPRLAPIKVAVLPLVRKDGMPETARKVVAQFFEAGVNAFYDEKDAVGRRYARQDEAGTPYCLTVDGQTAEDETVTIRERDSMQQDRIKVAEAVAIVRKRLAE